MRIFLFIISSVFALSATAKTGQKKAFSREYGMAGCGWGSGAMGKDGNQVLAATTNGTSWSQYFGITSETANCVDSSVAQVAHKSDVYIQFNKYALQGDIATGKGETLAGYGAILGCKAPEKLGPALRANYGQIYAEENNTPNEVTDAIITVIQNDSELTGSCQLG